MKKVLVLFILGVILPVSLSCGSTNNIVSRSDSAGNENGETFTSQKQTNSNWHNEPKSGDTKIKFTSTKEPPNYAYVIHNFKVILENRMNNTITEVPGGRFITGKIDGTDGLRFILTKTGAEFVLSGDKGGHFYQNPLHNNEPTFEEGNPLRYGEPGWEQLEHLARQINIYSSDPLLYK